MGAAHARKQSLFYGLRAATLILILIVTLTRGTLQCLRLVHPHRAPKESQQENGSSKCLQLEGTAHSQKFHTVRGEFFPIEECHTEQGWGEEMVKKVKKKGGGKKKSQNCVNNLCISIPQLLHLSIGIQKHLGQHLKVNNVHKAIWTKLQAKIKA